MNSRVSQLTLPLWWLALDQRSWRSKIFQHDLALQNDLDISGFDVTVDKWWVLGVQVDQGVAHLDDPRQDFGLRQGAFPEHLTQVLPLDEVHDQILSLVGDNKVVNDPRQVGVDQFVQNLRFAFELPLGLRGGVQFFLYGARALKV